MNTVEEGERAISMLRRAAQTQDLHVADAALDLANLLEQQTGLIGSGYKILERMLSGEISWGEAQVYFCTTTLVIENLGNKIAVQAKLLDDLLEGRVVEA